MVERPGAEMLGDGTSHGVTLMLIASVLLAVALGLVMVWINIERTKIAYDVRSLQAAADSREELNNKLLVERDYLLSPHHLGRKAEGLGLYTPQPGQIRKLSRKTPESARGTP